MPSGPLTDASRIPKNDNDLIWDHDSYGSRFRHYPFNKTFSFILILSITNYLIGATCQSAYGDNLFIVLLGISIPFFISVALGTTLSRDS